MKTEQFPLSSFSFMEVALGEAVLAQADGEVPVGAVLIHQDSGRIRACARNQQNHTRNPLLHAEMRLLLDVLSEEGPFLDAYALYVTLEPCALCAAALERVRIGKLVFGAYDPKGGGVVHGPRLLNTSTTVVIGGIEEQRCSTLLTQFFENLRKEKITHD